MDETRNREQPAFCTRNGRFDMLTELAASTGTAPATTKPATRAQPADERPAAAWPGCSRYFRWASRST